MEETRQIHECDIEKFSTLDISENMIAILGDRWWPQKAKQKEGEISKNIYLACNMWKNVMSAQVLEVSLLGVGTVLRLDKDAWSMGK